MSKGFCRPDLFEIQLLSYSKLLQKGLLEELTKLSPIKRLTVDRVGPHICYDIGRNLFIRILPQTLRIVADNNSDEKHSIKSRQTYVLDVYVGMQIVFEGTVQGKLQFIYLGQIPRMTSQGGFIHNGLKKTIISQLVRSPGIYFNTESQINPDLMPKRIATLIPNYGSWLKFEHKIDKNENETIMVQVNQTEKMPALEFLMALGFSQEKLYELIPILRDMAWKREGKNESGIIVKPIYEREILANSTTQALQQIQTFINPESVPTPLEIRESLWHQFRDPKYYDLGVMGRIQLDQKLDFGGRLPKARLFNTLIQWNNLLGSHVNAPSRSTPTFRSSFLERRGLFRKAISPEGSPLRESEGRKAIVATTSWFQLARSAETLEPTVKTSGLIAYQGPQAALDAFGTSYSSGIRASRFAPLTTANPLFLSTPRRVAQQREGRRRTAARSAQLNLLLTAQRAKSNKFLTSEGRKFSSGFYHKPNIKHKKDAAAHSLPLEARVLNPQDILRVVELLVGPKFDFIDDDIDALSNRRVRGSGELIQNEVKMLLRELVKTTRNRLHLTSNIYRENELDPNHRAIQIFHWIHFKRWYLLFAKRSAETLRNELVALFPPTVIRAKRGNTRTLFSSLRDEKRFLRNKSKRYPQLTPSQRREAPKGALRVQGRLRPRRVNTAESLQDSGHTLTQLFCVFSYNFTKAQCENYRIGIPNLDKVLNKLFLLDSLSPFFNFSPLCQYLDQINPLADITHKRRITTRGPGGITSARGAFKIRDIHPTFYGRLCPIETPEGKNAGLISSLASYARLNSHGFLETPFYQLNFGQPQQNLGPFFLSPQQEYPIKAAPGDLMLSNSTQMAPFPQHKPLPVFPKVLTNRFFETPVLVATQQEECSSASALRANTLRNPSEPLVHTLVPTLDPTLDPTLVPSEQEGCAATPEGADEGQPQGADEHRQEQQVPLEPTATSSRTLALTGDTKGLVPIRCKQEFLQTYITQVDFLSLSPIQMISVATSLIPFLEHDDANRALMGSNMQRQSVPLVKPERPIVGTGFEGKVARDSRYVLTAGSTGIITQADSQVICLTQYLKKNVMPSLLRSCLNKKRKDLFEYSIEKKVRKFHSKLCHKRVLRSNIYRNLSSYSQALKPISPRVPRTNWEIYSKKSIFRRRAKVRSLFSFRLVTFSFILLHLEISYPFIWLIWLNYVRYTRLFATVSRPPARSAPGSVGGSLSTKGIVGGKGSSGLTSLPVGSIGAKLGTERSPVPLVDTRWRPGAAPLPSFGRESGADELKLRTGEGQPQGADELSSRREEWLRADGTTVKTWNRGKELVSNLIKITTIYNLASFERSNQKTLVNQKPIVYRGEWVKQNGILADGASTCGGELALGKNVLVAYMPWEGYNFEDAILISDRLIREDIYTSIYIDKYEFQIPEKIPPDFIVATLDFTCITRDFSHIPYITEFDLRNLDDSGIIKVGSWVKPGDILIGRIKSAPFLNYYYPGLSTKRQQKPGLIGTKKKISPQKFTTKSLDDLIHWKKGFTDVSYRVPSLVKGRIVDVKFLTETSIQISIAQSRKIQVGDKLAGRHGNKGIVSKILPQQHMPCLQNGTPIDMVLSPLGVPSRMNVGQIFECLFGLAGKYLREHYKVLPFDEMYGKEASRSLVYHKLYEARKKTGYSWLFEPNSPGKSYIFDGRTATVFQQPVTVGYPYMLKLIHQVQDKLHARHIGPYATKTQQPLRGKRNQGGQRLGEMEVWALEAFGASYILQEMLTLKADSIVERKKISHTISQGDFIKKKEFSQKLKSVFVDPNSTRRMEDTSSSPTEGEPKERRRFSLVEHWDPLPEAFKLLIYELRVLCFEIQLEPIKSDIINPSDRFLLGTESKFQHRGSNSNDLENVDFKMLEKYMIKKDWL